METYIAYFDETGDDGVTCASSEQFVLTSIYMSSVSWQNNYATIKSLRRILKEKYGFHVTEEMHTKDFLADKDPYRKYHWANIEKIDILKSFAITIATR